MNHMQWFIGCQFVSCQLQMQNGQNSNDIAACISVQVDMTKYSVHFYSALKQKWEWKIKYSRTHQLSILFKSQGIASTGMHRKTFVFRVVLWSFFFFFTLVFYSFGFRSQKLQRRKYCAYRSFVLFFLWLRDLKKKQQPTPLNIVKHSEWNNVQKPNVEVDFSLFFSLCIFDSIFTLNQSLNCLSKTRLFISLLSKFN